MWTGRLVRSLAAAVVSAGAVFAAPAGLLAQEKTEAVDEKTAKTLYLRRSCVACHGRNGQKAIQDYPALAGQRADYMIQQVEDIISGKRTGSPDASDINPGTEALPFKTIRKSTQSLQPGDIVLIKAGTYRETVILHRSGTQENPIQIWAYPGDEGKVIINAAEPVTDW